MPAPGPDEILDTQLVRPAALARPLADGSAVTVGGLVRRTLEAWWAHLLAFTAMSVVVYAPAAVGFTFLWRLADRRPPAADVALAGGAALAGWGLTVALAVVQAGAVTYGTFRHLSGERARLAEMAGVGIRRGLPVVAVGFLLWLAIGLGLVLLIVPGVLVMVITAVSVPAAVVERPGVVGALRRSRALTRGHRWTLFAAGLATLAIVWVLSAAVQVGATVATATLLPGPQALAATLVASQLGNALFSAIPLVGLSVAYHDLRVAKEGVDTAALAGVFE